MAMTGHHARSSDGKMMRRRKGRSKEKGSGLFIMEKEEHHNLKAIDEMQAEGVTTVPARTSAPPRRSKLRGQFTAAAANEDSLRQPGDRRVDGAELGEDNDVLDRKSICEQIIMGGHVQTFVDFFYLTHRPHSPAAEDDGIVLDHSKEGADTVTAEVDASKREMIFIRDHLVSAEIARRRGDTPVVYEAYISLAQHYQGKNDPKTGVYFHEKCLEISRLTNDKRGEMAANHRLGLVYDELADLAMATRLHERHLELAQASCIPEEQEVASAALMQVYRKIAEEYEADGCYEKSIEFWTKSLGAARAAGEKATVGHACYRLGRAYTELGDSTRAVNYLEDFQNICGELDDLEGRGRACEALAAVHQSLGEDERALQLLQEYLDIATKTQNLGAQEAACSNLGLLHSRRGQHAKAKDMFERNFVISRKIPTTHQGGVTTGGGVDMSRALLGIAAGNEMARDYMNAVINDLGALLCWKSNRVISTMKRINSPPPTAWGDNIQQ